MSEMSNTVVETVCNKQRTPSTLYNIVRRKIEEQMSISLVRCRRVFNGDAMWGFRLEFNPYRIVYVKGRSLSFSQYMAAARGQADEASRFYADRTAFRQAHPGPRVRLGSRSEIPTHSLMVDLVSQLESDSRGSPVRALGLSKVNFQGVYETFVCSSVSLLVWCSEHYPLFVDLYQFLVEIMSKYWVEVRSAPPTISLEESLELIGMTDSIDSLIKLQLDYLQVADESCRLIPTLPPTYGIVDFSEGVSLVCRQDDCEVYVPIGVDRIGITNSNRLQALWKDQRVGGSGLVFVHPKTIHKKVSALRCYRRSCNLQGEYYCVNCKEYSVSCSCSHERHILELCLDGQRTGSYVLARGHDDNGNKVPDSHVKPPLYVTFPEDLCDRSYELLPGYSEAGSDVVFPAPNRWFDLGPSGQCRYAAKGGVVYRLSVPRGMFGCYVWEMVKSRVLFSVTAPPSDTHIMLCDPDLMIAEPAAIGTIKAAGPDRRDIDRISRQFQSLCSDRPVPQRSMLRSPGSGSGYTIAEKRAIRNALYHEVEFFNSCLCSCGRTFPLVSYGCRSNDHPVHSISLVNIGRCNVPNHVFEDVSQVERISAHRARSRMYHFSEAGHRGHTMVVSIVSPQIVRGTVSVPVDFEDIGIDRLINLLPRLIGVDRN